MADCRVLAPLHALVQRTPTGTRIYPVYSEVVLIPAPIVQHFHSGITFKPYFITRRHFHSSRAKKMDAPIIYNKHHVYEVSQLTLLPWECVEPTQISIVGHHDGRKNPAAKQLAIWASKAVGPGVLLEYLLYLLSKEWMVVRFPTDGSHLTVVKDHAPVTIIGSLSKGTIVYDMEWRGAIGKKNRRLTLEEIQEGAGLVL